MNKKKLLTLVLTLALIGAVGVGATLAYFTDSKDVSNVVTMGHVEITLTEEATGDAITEKNGLRFENVVPGATIDKEPVITVADGSQRCYVRAKVEVVPADENGVSANDLVALTNALSADITKEGSNWKLVGDYYYYATALNEKEKVSLFKTVTIPAAWDNNVAGKGFKINVKAEAIQADGLKKATETEAGFFNEDGSWNITAEKILPYEN